MELITRAIPRDPRSYAFVFLNPKSAANPKVSQESAANGKSSAEIQKTAEKVKGKAKKVEMEDGQVLVKWNSLPDLSREMELVTRAIPQDPRSCGKQRLEAPKQQQQQRHFRVPEP
ncbi:hypothetical protein ACFX1Q_034720 [Malus domestica]